MQTVIGPNTNLPHDSLQPNVLLCCGEDRHDLVWALQKASAGKVEEQSSYRCYQFWRCANVLVGWTGIGTGCLEPLLFELLATQRIRRIALVGTAGKLAHSRIELTKPHLCDPAKCSYTGLDRMIGDAILHPRLPTGSDALGPPRAGICSTDLFYGFSSQAMNANFPLYSKALAGAYHDDTSQMDLIDMEVGQFYFLSDKYGGRSVEAYFACKGAANEMGQGEQQLANSRATILACVNAALALLKS